MITLFESAQFGKEERRLTLFENPIKDFALTADDDGEAYFSILEDALNSGFALAGYLAYEAGYVLQRQNVKDGEQQSAMNSLAKKVGYPLAHFGVFKQPTLWNVPADSDEGRDLFRRIIGEPEMPHHGEMVLGEKKESYHEKIRRIQEHILCGDVYQINYTTEFHIKATNPRETYARLREVQSARFSAYLETKHVTALSFSPELFFQTEGQFISATPMKGTAPRGLTEDADCLIRSWLQGDEKNRAENLMILDLLRNDLGRLCEIGSVTVPSLFDVETLETLHQMTSTVQGMLKPNTTLLSLFQALFPSGSITGAPKLKAMEVIASLEARPRGIYTGAIGYILPNTRREHIMNTPVSVSFRRSVFNVAIRTVVFQASSAVMGVGSGITIDSVADEEYDECRVKGDFLKKTRLHFDLLETCLCEVKDTSATIPFLEAHLLRMASSARYFGFAFSVEKITEILLAEAKSLPNGRYRMRLTVSKQGHIALKVTALPEHYPDEKKVMLCRVPTDSTKPWYYHKTTYRPLYSPAYERAVELGLWDVIFCNERGEISESAIGTVFLETQGKWMTPPLSAGILNGVFRQQFLREHPQCEERVISPDALFEADHIYIGNSVRGLHKIALLKGEFPLGFSSESETG